MLLDAAAGRRDFMALQPVPTSSPKYQCTLCRGLFDASGGYNDNGDFVCVGCYERREAVSTAQAPYVATNPSIRSLKPSSRSHAPLAIGAAFVLIGAVVFMATRNGRDNTIGATTTNSSGLQISPYSEVAAKFSVARSVEGWKLTNANESPVTIKSVVFNGEYSVLPAHWKGGWIFPDNATPLPATLSLGESLVVLRWDNMTGEMDEPLYYPKEVIFLDIYTDHGAFRYRPGNGFTPESPSRDDDKIASYTSALEAQAIARREADARAGQEITQRLKEQQDAAQQRADEFDKQHPEGQTPAAHVQ
jgi:hypothetical protein